MSKSIPTEIDAEVAAVELILMASRRVPAVGSALLRHKRHSYDAAAALVVEADWICRPNKSASASSAVRLILPAKKSLVAVAPLSTV